MNSPNITATPSAVPPVNAGGQDGALSLDASDAALDTALMGVLTGASKTQTPPLPAAGNPDAAPAPSQDGDPGQVEPEGTPTTDGEPEGEPKVEDDGKVLSQTGDAELDAALNDLTPAMRKHVVEVSKLLGDTVKPGELPRIGQLLSERHQLAETVATLTRERDEALQKAEAGGTPASATGTVALPENVAKLKSIGEVRARAVTARDSIRAIEDFLEENPEGGEVGGRTYSKKEMVQLKRQWQDELEALPQRQEQLQQTERFTQAQAQTRRQVLADYPWLNDPQHPVTSKIADAIKAVPLLKTTVAPEYWAAVLIRGKQAMDAELAQRKTKGNGGSPAVTPGVKPVGKVPARNPHAGGGGATAQPGKAMDRFRSALPKKGEKVTDDVMEAALSALPSRV